MMIALVTISPSYTELFFARPRGDEPATRKMTRYRTWNILVKKQDCCKTDLVVARTNSQGTAVSPRFQTANSANTF